MNPGHRIDRFVIERLLGRGGMAEVYAARDTQLARRVALKRLRGGKDDATSTVRFLREARFASAFHHPCAVVVYDIFEHENQPYIAMELVEGQTLRSLVGDASVPAERRIRWLVDTARALGAAHRAGLVHRDVKPHNIMVTDDGQVKVLDFGIARIDRSAGELFSDDSSEDSLPGITQTGVIIGTPLYASPEQLSAAQVDGRSDQFSWGLTAYELLCGYLPWRRRDAMTMLAQLVADDVPSMAERIAEVTLESQDFSRKSDHSSRSVPPPPNPALFEGVPLGVEPVVSCAMSRDPDQRFPTIDDAADALEEYAEEVRSVRGTMRALRAVASQRPPPGSGGTPVTSASAGPPKSPARGTPGGTTPGGASAQSPARAARCAATASDSAVPSWKKPASSTPFAASATPSSTTITPSGSATTPLLSLPEALRNARSDSDSSTAHSALIDRSAFDSRASSPTLRASGTPPPVEIVPWWRRPIATAAGAGMVLLGAMLGLSKLIERAPAPAVVVPAVAPGREVTRVPCGLAEVHGSLAVAKAPALLGAAACLRLAVELGVEWTQEPSESAVRVVVDTTAAPVRVTLAFAGAESQGEGRKPIDAIQAAVVPLAAALRRPAWTASQLAPWGAADATGAARALREMRRAGLLLSTDPRADLTRWTNDDARSPWPWLLLAGTSPDGDASAALARDRALPVAETLPPARATLVRGLFAMRAPARAGEVADGLRQIRRAYGLAPDDAEVGAVLAAALFQTGRIDEAMPIARRLFERGAATTLPSFALAADTDPDPKWIEERGRLLDALEVWVPESRGWSSRVRHELSAGRLEAARESVALADALGLPSAAHTGNVGRAWIALAELDTEQVRTLVRPLVVSPDPSLSNEAVRLLVQSYLLDGHATDAETELARDVERLLAVGNERLLATRYLWLLSMCRRLSQPVPSFVDRAKVGALAERLALLEDPVALALQIELFVLRVAAGDEKPAAADALMKRAEAFATQVSQGDRGVHHAVLSVVAPIAGYVLSPADTLKWWRSLERAPYAARLPHMFGMGLLCEQQGDTACAESAYHEAIRSPAAIDGLDYLSARLRLAGIMEKRGHRQEADRLREPVKRLTAGADVVVARLLERAMK